MNGAAYAPRIPFWLRLIPFFLSSILFLSAFLAIFSPLPIIILGLMGTSAQRSYVQRGWALLACVINSAIVFLLGGEVTLATYLVFALAPAWVMIELLARRKRLGTVAGGAFLSIAAAIGLVILFYAQIHHVHPWGEVKNAVSQFMDYWVKAVSSSGNLPVQDPAELDDMKKTLMTELPSAVAVIAVMIVWANLTIVLRLNPRNIRQRLGIRTDFFQTWKAPDWMVWPTILTGATLLTDLGVATDVGRNFFKVFMAIYAIQGLGILSFFMTRWRINKFFRTVGYLVAVLIAMPLLLSLGFFDLWFDFRSKFRQS
ncbi:MAG: DUF2232 domain-containing protein [Bdellovibrionia bacterium]